MQQLRKNGVDELVQSRKDRSRSENELIRASRHPFTLLVEELEGYQKILIGKYRSKYEPKALLGSLKTFEVRYNFSTVFIRPTLPEITFTTPFFIWPGNC